MAKTARLTRWPEDRKLPCAEELAKQLVGEGVDPFLMVDPPFTYSHTRVPNRTETRWIVEGKLQIQVANDNFELTAGDRLDIPEGVRHRIKVVSENGAVYLLASR